MCEYGTHNGSFVIRWGWRIIGHKLNYGMYLARARIDLNAFDLVLKVPISVYNRTVNRVDRLGRCVYIFVLIKYRIIS